jgi:hypothetical protein
VPQNSPLHTGIYGVGKAALHPPALAVLSHTPDSATQTIAWVGKGIVYDTGGLSIKGKVSCRFWGTRVAVRQEVSRALSWVVQGVFCAFSHSERHDFVWDTWILGPHFKQESGTEKIWLGPREKPQKQIKAMENRAQGHEVQELGRCTPSLSLPEACMLSD